MRQRRGTLRPGDSPTRTRQRATPDGAHLHGVWTGGLMAPADKRCSRRRGAPRHERNRASRFPLHWACRAPDGGSLPPQQRRTTGGERRSLRTTQSITNLGILTLWCVSRAVVANRRRRGICGAVVERGRGDGVDIKFSGWTDKRSGIYTPPPSPRDVPPLAGNRFALLTSHTILPQLSFLPPQFLSGRPSTTGYGRLEAFWTAFQQLALPIPHTHTPGRLAAFLCVAAADTRT